MPWPENDGLHIRSPEDDSLSFFCVARNRPAKRQIVILRRGSRLRAYYTISQNLPIFGRPFGANLSYKPVTPYNMPKGEGPRLSGESTAQNAGVIHRHSLMQ
jgi:hypothetical protein